MLISGDADRLSWRHLVLPWNGYIQAGQVRRAFNSILFKWAVFWLICRLARRLPLIIELPEYGNNLIVPLLKFLHPNIIFHVRCHGSKGLRRKVQRIAPGLLAKHSPTLWLEKVNVHNADVVTAPTKHYAAECTRYYGVPVGSYSNFVEEIAGPVNSGAIRRNPFFLYAGTLTTEKGYRELLSAFREFRTTHPNVELILAGHKQATTQIAQTGVEWVGRLSSLQLHQHMAAACAVVIPSYYETFGMVLVEAMSVEAVIVASDIAPFREIAENYERILFFTLGSTDRLLSALNNAFDLVPSERRVIEGCYKTQNDRAFDMWVSLMLPTGWTIGCTPGNNQVDEI